MSTCRDNHRLGRIGCGASYSGNTQHSVATVSWSRHPDGQAHVTASLGVIERLWRNQRTEMADPAALGYAQDSNGRWRQPMSEADKARMAVHRLRVVRETASDGSDDS